MIAGRQIANELANLIGEGADISKIPHSRKLPQTMRQLLEADFDVEDLHIDFGCCIQPQVDLKAGFVRRNYARNICAEQLNINRPILPAIGGKDYRGYYGLLSNFWKWLKKKRKAGKINIDHQLKEQPWPLMQRFEAEIKKRTGWNIDVFFPQVEWEFSDEEPQDWSAAWMPLYNLETEEDASPLIELLSNIGGEGEMNFPEAAFDGRDAEQVHLANDIFRQIIKKRRYTDLPQKWTDAIKALRKYKSGYIAYTDPDEIKLEIHYPDDIEHFLATAKDVADMIKGTCPLVQECYENSVQFWDEIITHLKELK